MVLRMIRNGADMTSSGTDAKAATPGPVVQLAEARQTARENPVPGAAHAGDGKAEQQREQHL
jgi:hypothetical protein